MAVLCCLVMGDWRIEGSLRSAADRNFRLKRLVKYTQEVDVGGRPYLVFDNGWSWSRFLPVELVVRVLMIRRGWWEDHHLIHIVPHYPELLIVTRRNRVKHQYLPKLCKPTTPAGPTVHRYKHLQPLQCARTTGQCCNRQQDTVTGFTLTHLADPTQRKDNGCTIPCGDDVVETAVGKGWS